MAITAKFEADFEQFKSAVLSAEGSLKSLEGVSKTLGPAILASLASTEVRRFAGDVQQAASAFIDAFAQEEAAVKKLDVALQAQGTAGALEKYRALATQFQNTTTYSDDLIISMQGLLVQVGGVMPGQMQAALTASANLSAGLGISLEQATMMVARAFSTGGENLGKLKTILGDSAPKGKDMAEVLAAINAKFGGQAAAQVETYTGRMAQLTNKLDDFKERVGGILVEALTPLIDAFAKLPDSVQATIVGVVAMGVALAPLALSFAAMVTVIGPLIPLIGTALAGAFAAIAPFLGPAGIVAAGIVAWFVVFKNLDVFIWAAVASWDALKNAFKSAASAITGYAQQLYEGVKTWLVDRFESIVQWVNQKIQAIVGSFRAMYQAVVGGSIVPDFISGIGSEFGKLDRVMVQPAVSAANQVIHSFNGMAGFWKHGATYGSPSTFFATGGAVAGGGGGGGSVTIGAINLYGMLGTNDPATKAQIAELVGAALSDALKQSKLLGTV